MKSRVVMVKGTNASGKSSLVFSLRKRGWKEKVIDRRKQDGICYTKFIKHEKTILVIGKYGEKGGGCDGLTKKQCLSTLNELWVRNDPIYFEGQNIADTLTTHIIYMLNLNGSVHNIKSRGDVPEPDFVPNKKRSIRVVCLTPDLDTVFKRLKKRTPDKVLKNGAAKTRQKHASVLRQMGEMKKWKETREGKIKVVQYRNMGTKKELFRFMVKQLGLK